MGEHDDPVLYRQSEKGDEAHRRGDVEGHPPHYQGQHTAEYHQRQQGYQQSGLTEIAEGEEQQQEHYGEGHRHDQRQPAEGPVLILKLSAPGITEIPVVVEHIVPYSTVGLGHEGGEVPVPEIDLDGGHTAVHLPGYHAGSYGSAYIGHSRERNLGPGSRGEHEGAYLLGRIPGLLGVTAGHVVDSAAHKDLGDSLSTQSHLNELSHIGHIEPVLGYPVPVHHYLQLRQERLLCQPDIPRSLDTGYDLRNLFRYAPGLIQVLAVYLDSQVTVRSRYLVHHHVDDRL